MISLSSLRKRHSTKTFVRPAVVCVVIAACMAGASLSSAYRSQADSDPAISSASYAASAAVNTNTTLTVSDVETIIAQAVAQAQITGLKATIAVVDQEGNVLGVFQMQGAPVNTVVGTGKTCPSSEDCGLEGLKVPSEFAAISKAGTGAFLSSQGNAFTTRTASFIIQEHFPPAISFTSSGPLFGVQFSQLPCSDVNPALPLGLSADPGGIPLYKNGHRAGGIGIEGDGKYGLSTPNSAEPTSGDMPPEELIAVAGSRGFEAPAEIQANQILVNGIRLPFVNTPMPPATSVPSFSDLKGKILVPVRGAQPSKFRVVKVGGIAGRVAGNFFPFRGSAGLTAADVEQIISQAAHQCIITRAAIRQPLGSAAQVNITVADVDGNILGIFSLPDAPLFGFDVSAQKARTAAFISGAHAAEQLLAAEGGKFSNFVSAAQGDGLKFNGSVAFTDRAGGFLSRPFFPDGIDGTVNGPFSRPIEEWSPFNDGLQVEIIRTALLNILAGKTVTSCTDIPGLTNGNQIFPGSAPLYKNGQLVGAIGISGDGVDQDDLISGMGMAGFEAPAQIRSDQVFVRGVRLPYLKYPRHPDL
jgi:uncharacterized protein GlcG (DUF336 family)